MNVLTRGRWIFGLRAVCGAVIASAAVATIAPSAQAAHQVNPSELVANFISDLNDAFDNADARGDDLVADITDKLDAAVEDGKLKPVLKIGDNLDKIITKRLGTFDKSAAKRLAKAIKTLDKVDADPAFATQLQNAVNEKVAAFTTLHTDLGLQLRTLVDDAIDDIEAQIDVN